MRAGRPFVWNETFSNSVEKHCRFFYSPSGATGLPRG